MAVTEFCAACGATGDLSEHHLRPRVSGGEDGPTVNLCEKCHGEAHGVIWRNHAALTRQALARKRRQGRRVGQVPYGFTLAEDEDRLLPNAEEQEIIDEIRRRREAGEALQAIADDLNAREVPTKKQGGSWWPATVSNIAKAVA